MKRRVLISLVLLLGAACSKSGDTASSSSTAAATATDAAAAVATATAAESAATDVPSTAATDAVATATDAGAAAESAPPEAGASSLPASSSTAVALPVYPGALAIKDRSISMSTGNGSLKVDSYQTVADAKTVIEWYKAHLPSTWQNFSMTSGGKTVGTFSLDLTGGATSGGTTQSVIVTTGTDGKTDIQLSTKTGT
jgi:hypothetical protein